MSENIPESIPTSADPRSKRATKKRALSPRSQNAAQLDALFARPDQEIRIPQANTTARAEAAVPEIVANVQGSSAGAGSGEFHVYKASRRREYERLRAMDDEVRKEEDSAQWEREKAEREAKDSERTKKNRMKREKLKARKAGKGQSGSGREQIKQEPHEVVASSEDTTMAGKAAREEPRGLTIHDDD